jgi:hypothetical protein
LCNRGIKSLFAQAAAAALAVVEEETFLIYLFVGL